MTDRTLVARGVLGTVDAAMNVAGGAAFFRRHGLEQLFRDAQGARFHPLQEGRRKRYRAHALGELRPRRPAKAGTRLLLMGSPPSRG